MAYFSSSWISKAHIQLRDSNNKSFSWHKIDYSDLHIINSLLIQRHISALRANFTIMTHTLNKLMKYHQGCCLEKMTFYFWTKMLMDSSLNLQNVYSFVKSRTDQPVSRMSVRSLGDYWYSQDHQADCITIGTTQLFQCLVMTESTYTNEETVTIKSLLPFSLLCQ